MHYSKTFIKSIIFLLLCNSVALASTSYNINGFIFTEYTDKNEWLTDITGTLYQEDFNDSTLIPELSITSIYGSINSYNDFWYDQLYGNRETETSFYFSEVTNAFGGDWTIDTRYQGLGSNGLGISIFFDLESGDTVKLPREIPNDLIGFYGIILPDDILFNDIRLGEGTQGITSGNETYYLDNLVFTNPSPVPLPGALWLMISGLAMGSAVALRKKPNTN